MALLLPRSEYERIKRLASEEVFHSDTHKRKEKLRQLSKQREATWPNTLAAQRKLKYDKRMQREAQLEKERQKVDKKEETIRSQQRKLAIEKAKRQMYEQKDRIKGFRSQQLLSDVLREQMLQQNDRVKKAEFKQNRDAYFHNITMKSVEQGDRKEAEKLALRRAKAKEFASLQIGQLKAYTQRHIDKLVQERIEGQLVLENAKKGIEEENKKVQARRRQARHNNIEMGKANELLKEVKLLKLQELQKEQDKIVEYAKQRDEISGKRKQHKLDKQKEKQRQVQEMIDRAVTHLAAMQNNEDQRLEREVEAKKEKDDEKVRKKAEYRRKHWEAIDRSREAQMARRSSKRQVVKTRDVEMKIKWAAQREALEIQEMKEREDKRLRSKKLQKFVLEQRSEKRDREQVRREEALRLAEVQKVKDGKEENEINAFLRAEIAEAEAAGKNIETMKRSLIPNDEIKGFVFY